MNSHDMDVLKVIGMNFLSSMENTPALCWGGEGLRGESLHPKLTSFVIGIPEPNYWIAKRVKVPEIIKVYKSIQENRAHIVTKLENDWGFSCFFDPGKSRWHQYNRTLIGLRKMIAGDETTKPEIVKNLVDLV